MVRRFFSVALGVVLLSLFLVPGRPDRIDRRSSMQGWNDARRAVERDLRRIRVEPDGARTASGPGYVARFDADGVVLRPFGAPESLRFGWGRLDGDVPCGEPGFEHEGTTIRRRNGGALLERWENRAEGLEHLFEVAERPAGPLVVRIAIEGTLRPSTSDHGLRFQNEAGRDLLAYESLKVFDARGRRLDARMSLEGNDLAVHVDDRGAAYPVLIDPLVTAPSWTSSGEELEKAYFGWSVASAGDVNGDGFDDVIVGAPGAIGFATDPETDLLSRRGRAYIFLGSPTGVSTDFAWVTEGDGNAETNYGRSVASAGDVNGDGFDDVIVGAPDFLSPTAGGNFGGALAGKAYLFLGGPGGPDTTPDWTSIGDDQSLAGFGSTVASAGDVNGDGFDDVIIGAPAFNAQGAAPAMGKAYDFHGASSGLGTSPAWTSSVDAVELAGFGSSVASAGDVDGDGFDDVIIGAEFFDAPGPDRGFNTGKAYVYRGSAAGLATSAVWTAQAPGTPSPARFGISVDSAGDVNGDGFDDIAVGASAENTSLEAKVFVYHGSPAGPSVAPSWTVVGGPLSAFGHSVAGVGDVESDGFDDLLVGDPTFVTGGIQAGAAFLYAGSPSGLTLTDIWSSSGDTEFASEFGTSVAGAGDVNGDGFADAIVGAPTFARSNHMGKAYVFHGFATGTGPSYGSTVVSAAGGSDGGDRCGALGMEAVLVVGLLSLRRRRAGRPRA